MEYAKQVPKIDDRDESRYRVGDAVYAQDRGPYLVAKVLERGQYSLCHHDGAMAEGGKGINEKDMKGPKFNVGNKVCINIRDYKRRLQHRGPYFIAQVLLGGKYILRHPNRAIAEGGQAIDGENLVGSCQRVSCSIEPPKYSWGRQNFPKTQHIYISSMNGIIEDCW